MPRFWLFVSVMYGGQIWWLSRLPGEMINVRQAITWQTTYFLLWIPLTLLVWRVTSRWTARVERRVDADAAPARAGVRDRRIVHFISVSGVSVLLGGAARRLLAGTDDAERADGCTWSC